ncbi:MAG: hypothetical protein QGD88_09665 [Anaerolineae bacterium]|nr:hypothetical protein [Anaerolineae bacterium]
MQITTLIIGGIVILFAIYLIYTVFSKARKVNLTGSTGEKPEWMRTTPPPETLAATKADGEGVTLYDHDPGEKIAAPFAEQIEDIVRVKLKSDSYLKKFEIDLGTSSGGGLEIWVNGEMFEDVKSLPDKRLQAAFKDAIKQWDKGQ